MIGLLIATLIIGWAFYGLHVIGLNQAVLLDTSEPIAKWFEEPGNSVKVLLWIGVTLVNVIVFIWVKDPDSFVGDRRGEAISIGIAVIVIDELVSYRSKLERKQEIISQIESPVRDIAVEAVRVARENGFLHEALGKVSPEKLKLSGVDLSLADLRNKD